MVGKGCARWRARTYPCGAVTGRRSDRFAPLALQPAPVGGTGEIARCQDGLSLSTMLWHMRALR